MVLNKIDYEGILKDAQRDTSTSTTFEKTMEGLIFENHKLIGLKNTSNKLGL